MKYDKTNVIVLTSVLVVCVLMIWVYAQAFKGIVQEINEKENGLVKGDTVRHGNEKHVVLEVNSLGHGRIYGSTYVTEKSKVKCQHVID